jgi:hypothetical protein
MAGVDFDRDFPQPPADIPATPSAPSGRRISFRDDAPVVVALLHPLRIDEENSPTRDIEQLTIVRITADQMIEIVEAIGEDADDATVIRHVTAAMAGIDADIMASLSPDDAGRLSMAARPFLPAGLVAAIERSVARDAEATDEPA